jgi:hypothetical protein
MTRNEIQLLKELTAAGEHGRVINTPTSSARSEIAYLTSAHYIKRLSHTKLYVITERGREALKTIWANCHHLDVSRRPGRIEDNGALLTRRINHLRIFTEFKLARRIVMLKRG